MAADGKAAKSSSKASLRSNSTAPETSVDATVSGKLANPQKTAAEEIAKLSELIHKTAREHDKKLDEIRATTASTEAKLTDFADRLSSVESRLDFLEDAERALKADPPATRGEVQMLREKVDELDNRGRRNNLRIIGFPEGCEGRDAAGFLAAVLPEILGADFNVELEFERAHRSPAPVPQVGKPPRPIIVCFLRHTDKERVREAARKKGKVVWKDRGKKEHHIMFFPDYSKAVVERCAAFNKCKEMLHDGNIKFSLVFPATLMFTTNGGRRYRFVDHKEAEAVIQGLM